MLKKFSALTPPINDEQARILHVLWREGPLNLRCLHGRVNAHRVAEGKDVIGQGVTQARVSTLEKAGFIQRDLSQRPLVITALEHQIVARYLADWLLAASIANNTYRLIRTIWPSLDDEEIAQIEQQLSRIS